MCLLCCNYFSDLPFHSVSALAIDCPYHCSPLPSTVLVIACSHHCHHPGLVNTLAFAIPSHQHLKFLLASLPSFPCVFLDFWGCSPFLLPSISPWGLSSNSTCRCYLYHILVWVQYPISFLSYFLFFWTFSDSHFFNTLTVHTCHGYPLPYNAKGMWVSTPLPYSWLGISNISMSSFYALVMCWYGPKLYSYIWHVAQNASNYTSLISSKSKLAACWLSTCQLILQYGPQVHSLLS